VLKGRVPGLYRRRSIVWWLTIAACLSLAAAIVGVMVLVGR
jgi:hypothetical protein